MNNLVLMGRSGSGKTTLARQYVARHPDHFVRISSGEIAQDLQRQDARAKDALRRGDYAPESAMRLEILSRVERADHEGKHFIMEGFPRRIDQLIVLEKALPMPPLYIWLECSAYACLRRILDRNRKFDEPDAIASRFAAYEHDTQPLIDMLIQSGAPIWSVDCNGSPESGIAELERIIPWERA